MDRLRLLPLLLAASLSGCATSYQSSGFTGGYLEAPAPGEMIKIRFYGNGYTRPETVGTFTIYRVAELAKEKNKPYFVMYRTLGAAAMDIPTDTPDVGLLGSHPSAAVFALFLDETRFGAKNTAEVLRDLEHVVRPRASEQAK